MLIPFKKFFFNITFNSFLFLILIIGIQNSSKKEKINLILAETIQLPISFIIGSSFITGSIFGSFINLNFNNKDELKMFTEKSDVLFNQYGITLVNPARCPNVKFNIANKFIKWLTSSEGQTKIKAFKVKGEQLFFPNAN